MARELVNPGLSIPSKFMNPGNPSSSRIIKSWNLEPFGPNFGLQSDWWSVLLPYAGVVSNKSISIDIGKVLPYSLIHFVEMSVIHFIICRVFYPLYVWPKLDTAC